MKIIIISFVAFLLFQGCLKLGNKRADFSTEPVYTRIDSLITPTLTGGKNIESDGYDLTWSRSKDGCQYEVEECYSPNFIGSIVIYRGTDRFYTVNNPNHYRVRAVDLGFASNWSNVLSLY